MSKVVKPDLADASLGKKWQEIPVVEIVRGSGANLDIRFIPSRSTRKT
jgi:hypothetical protein